MKHFLFAGRSINTMLNTLFLGLIAFGFSAAPSLATSQGAVMIPSLVIAQGTAAAPSPATGQTMQNALEQTSLDQQQVRAHTAAIVAQVQTLIDELAANGISGDDAKTLEATKAALAHLSGPEMDRVIASLQQAGTAASAGNAAHNAVNAYIAQKGIILQFRMILAEYAERQATLELQARFNELTHRQTDTMRSTEQIAAATAGRPVTELSTTDQTTQQIVQTDQNAIVNEANLAGEQLNKAAEGSSGDEAKPLQKARDDMKSGQVNQALAQADEDLKAGKLLKALSEQLAARDGLRRITLDLNPPADPVEALAQTAVDLARLIEEQKKLLAQTTSAISSHVMVSGLNDQQGVLVDEATLVQQDIQALSEPAAGLVKEAIDPPMQTSRAQLRNLGGLPLASTSQEMAITKLEEAQKLLEQQLTDARNKETEKEIAESHEPATDPSALKGASEKLTEAQTNVSIAMTSATPPDGNPSDTTPPPGTPPDSNPLAGNPPNGSPPTGMPPDSNPLAGNPPNSTPPATNSPTGTPPDGNPLAGNPPNGSPPPPVTMPDAVKALTKAATKADEVANTPGLPETTKTAVTEAKTEIEKGKKAAGEGDAPGTATHAGAAMTALIKAQATLGLAMAGMPGAPGPPGLSGPPMPAPPGPGQPGSIAAQTITPGSNQPSQLHDVSDHTAKFIPVQPRIRVALGQTGTEKRPQEYAPLIDQYLKNLADESTAQ